MYRSQHRAVAAAAWAICRDDARAEECAQEAFARAYARWRRLGRSGYAVAWVHRVALNLAVDEVRRDARARRPQVIATVGHSPALPPSTDGDLWLVEQLRRLPRRQREAVYLRVVADLPEEACAAAMGVSAGSVKTHRSRGLARLRQLLHATEED